MNTGLINLARLAGIEPTTPWFVAKYSIQLSYSREKFNYISDLIFVQLFMCFLGKVLLFLWFFSISHEILADLPVKKAG